MVLNFRMHKEKVEEENVHMSRHLNESHLINDNKSFYDV